MGRRERPARGPKPTLTLERIVDGGDRGGRRRRARRRLHAPGRRRAGCGHDVAVPVRAGQVGADCPDADTVSDPAECIDPVDGSRRWRARLEAAARGLYRLYLAHPWLLRTDWSRPVLGPNTLARMEYVIASLSGLGLTDQEQVTVMIALDGFVSGFARQRIQAEALQRGRRGQRVLGSSTTRRWRRP